MTNEHAFMNHAIFKPSKCVICIYTLLMEPLMDSLVEFPFGWIDMGCWEIISECAVKMGATNESTWFHIYHEIFLRTSLANPVPTHTFLSLNTMSLYSCIYSVCWFGIKWRATYVSFSYQPLAGQSKQCLIFQRSYVPPGYLSKSHFTRVLTRYVSSTLIWCLTCETGTPFFALDIHRVWKESSGYESLNQTMTIDRCLFLQCVVDAK